MAPTTRSMSKRQPSLARQRSIRRSHSSAERQKVLGPRPLLQIRRQPSIRRPAPAPFSARHQPAPLRPQPSQRNPPAIRLQSLESVISPPPRRNAGLIVRQKSVRRAPTFIRQGPSLAWEPREGPPPAAPQDVARAIARVRDLPSIMRDMPAVERRVFRNAAKAGEWPTGFSSSQLAFAALIARAQPADMGLDDFIAKLLRRVGNERRVVTDERLCFDSLDYVKDLLVRSNEDLREMTGKYERERIARKRAERVVKQSGAVAPLEVLEDGAPQLIGMHQVEAAYPNINEADNLRAQGANQNIPLICYLLLRHSRILHSNLSVPDISPTKLSASILATIKAIADVLGSTNLYLPTHFSLAQLRQAFKIASSVFSICLRGLSYLCRDIPGRKQKSRVIYELCALFKKGLKLNEDLCAAVAKEAYDIAREDLPLAARGVLDGLILHEVEIPYLLPCRTEFLAAIFLSKELAAQPRQKCYVEVLEGLSAELYTKVGTLISETVFKEQVVASVLFGHISRFTLGEEPEPAKELAVAIERNQVSKLLQVVVGRLSTASGADGNDQNPALHLAQLISTEKLLTGSDGNHGRLFKIAKDKLQHTLCKAVFGEDDGEFREALKGAQWEDDWAEDLQDGQVVVNDDGHKFVEDMWEMIGWDMLEGI